MLPNRLCCNTATFQKTVVVIINLSSIMLNVDEILMLKLEKVDNVLNGEPDCAQSSNVLVRVGHGNDNDVDKEHEMLSGRRKFF